MPRGKRPAGSASKVTSVTAQEKQEAKAAVTIPQDKTERITKWREIVPLVSSAVETERQLRTSLVADLFSPTKLTGTEYAEIGWGYKLKAEKNLNISVIKDNNKVLALIDALNALEPGLSQEFIKWVPEASMTGYKRVLELASNPQYEWLRPLLSEVITVTPGMPTLEMIAPSPDAPQQTPVQQSIPIPSMPTEMTLPTETYQVQPVQQQFAQVLPAVWTPPEQ